MKKDNNKNGLKWLIYLILGGFLIKFLRFVFKGDNEKKIAKNFKDFFKKEKKEVDELVSGKESFKKYCEDSGSIFKNYFIPNDRNDFKPKILRTKPLAIIAITLLLLKASVAGYLFFIYPNLAKMSELIQNEVYSLININRADNNVPVLSMNDKLNEIARKKAEDMIKQNYFAHKNPDGKMIWDMIGRGEYPYLYVGENLAINFTSAQSVSSALMLSASHRKNILNPKYSEIGVAVVAGEINGKKTNVLVQLFAYPKAVTAALAVATSPKQETAPALLDKEKEEPPVQPVEPAVAAADNTESAVEPPLAVNGAKPDKSAVANSQVLPVEHKDGGNKSLAEAEQPLAESRVLSAETEAGDNKIPADAKKTIVKEFENKKIIEESPNKELEAMASVKEVSVEVPRQYGSATKVINYSQYIFIAALVLLILLLLVNILVRAGIQHKPVIIQTFLLIIFVYGMITVKFNFLQYITEKILVL